MGETTTPFRYYLNQVPNDYTVEVRNRFKGLDLIDRVPDELWMGVKRIEVKSKGEKERYTHLNAEFQRIARIYQNVFQ